MKKSILLILISLNYCHFTSAQPNVTTFSELSGRQTIYSTNANITAISDGYLVQSFYRKVGNGFLTLLYKISPSGKILDSMFLNFDGKDVYSDEIIRKGNLNYQLGYVAQSKTTIKPPKRCLIVFDDNLKIIKKYEYDIIPANGFPTTNTSNEMVGDTIVCVRNYILLDSLINLLPGSPTQIERIGINGEVFGVTNINDRAVVYSDAVVANNRLFVFGWVASEPPNMNPFPVGEYTLDGAFVKVHQSGAFVGRMAASHNNLIYYVDQGTLYQRNAKFELFKSVKLLDESFSLSIDPSYKAHAFDNKDNLFYLHRNEDYFGNSVFKVNNKLEVVWEKKMGPIGNPNFIIGTNEGGCLVGFTVPLQSGTSLATFLLYKLDDLGNITSVETIRQPAPQQALFYPNPFRSQLTLQQGVEGATQVCLYDMNGRTVGTYTLDNNSISVDDFLPTGTYMAQLKDAKGKILGVQTVVRE